MCFWATSLDAGLISLRLKTKQFLETLHCTTLISHHLGLLNSQRPENKMSLRANTFFAHDFFNQLILSEMSNQDLLGFVLYGLSVLCRPPKSTLPLTCICHAFGSSHNAGYGYAIFSPQVRLYCSSSRVSWGMYGLSRIGVRRVIDPLAGGCGDCWQSLGTTGC